MGGCGEQRGAQRPVARPTRVLPLAGATPTPTPHVRNPQRHQTSDSKRHDDNSNTYRTRPDPRIQHGRLHPRVGACTDKDERASERENCVTPTTFIARKEANSGMNGAAYSSGVNDGELGSSGRCAPSCSPGCCFRTPTRARWGFLWGERVDALPIHPTPLFTHPPTTYPRATRHRRHPRPASHHPRHPQQTGTKSAGRPGERAKRE